MNWDEYNKLFHKLELNLSAFKPLMECDKQVPSLKRQPPKVSNMRILILMLVNAAIEEEREACANMADECVDIEKLGEAIRTRGQREES
jgi:hypothetical protein